MNEDESIDVLMVQRACSLQYPPTAYQARLMAEAGLRVAVADLEGAAFQPWPESVPRHTAHRAWDPKREPPPPLAVRIANRLRFAWLVRRSIARFRPKVVWAYDVFGCDAVTPAPGRYRTVYHFHELSAPEPGGGWGLRAGLRAARRHAHRADRLVCADRMRAVHFKDWAGLDTEPDVVMNCPLKLEAAPTPQRITGGLCVGYLGSVGENQALTEVAASMAAWPADAEFVLIGAAGESMRRAIERCAGPHARRVRFLGALPREQAWPIVAGFDIGLALIQPNTLNLRYAAGAVNKRFEYMALGVPQLADNNPGVPELIEGGGVGCCADPYDIGAIGRAINRMGAAPDERKAMGHRARAAHLERYHYAAQFEALLDWTLRVCGKDRA